MLLGQSLRLTANLFYLAQKFKIKAEKKIGWQNTKWSGSKIL